MKDILVILASFGACSVEMVEALTIVLAVGITRGWRSALMGVGAGFVALVVVVSIMGPALVTLVPLNALRVVVGALLLIFGMQWLRKAILRASGLKSQHDEDQIFKDEVSELEGSGLAVAAGSLDWTGFVVSFKGVFLEGLEVAFIVLTFGANSGGTRGWELSAAGALIAFVVIGGLGLKIHKPLSRVPENTIKFVVALMLMSFGTFWGGEGVGVDWAASDVSIFGLVAFYGLMAYLTVSMLKSRVETKAATASMAGAK